MDLILIGCGGCMRELAWQISKNNNYRIIGYVDQNCRDREILVGDISIPYLGDDTYITKSEKDINVVISVGNPTLRKQIESVYSRNSRVHFPNIFLNDNKICSDLKIGKGCIISSECVISTNVKIDNFVFLNIGSLVCHDCELHDFVTLNPNSQLAGTVRIEELSMIGMNATIIQGIKIGKNVIVGAGATVIKDINNDSVVVGVPARKVNK